MVAEVENLGKLMKFGTYLSVNVTPMPAVQILFLFYPYKEVEVK
jgi:hypothetical protein